MKPLGSYHLWHQDTPTNPVSLQRTPVHHPVMVFGRCGMGGGGGVLVHPTPFGGPHFVGSHARILPRANQGRRLRGGGGLRDGSSVRQDLGGYQSNHTRDTPHVVTACPVVRASP